MKLGVCTSIELHDAAHAAGFEYIEPTVGSLVPDRPDDAFAPVMQQVAGAPLSPEAFNCFLPASLKVTGADADLDALMRYVTVACKRAAQIGGKVIVFGSGGARTVPDGFPIDEAMSQVTTFLAATGVIAGQSGITIAIEPLRKAESNIINLVSEAYQLARRVAHPAVRALADIFHMAHEGEPYSSVIPGGDLLAHVHISHPITRKAPQPGDGCDYTEFFRALKQAGYDGRISVECAWDDFAAQAPAAVDLLKTDWERS